jgi:hypothetical protein
VFVNHLPQEIWRTALIATCAFAFWRGGRPERIVAFAFLVASFTQPLVLNTTNWLDPQWGVLVVDSVLLAFLVGLALRTDRSWLLFCAAFQLLSVVIHIAILVDRSVAPLPYRRGLVIWSYLTLVALAWGTWRFWRSRQANDPRA